MQRSTDAERSHSATLDDAPSTADTRSGGPDGRRATRATDGSRRSRLRRRVGRLFSLRVFLGSLLLAVVGMTLGGAVPLVGFAGRIVGLFVVGFLVGLLAEHRRYLEVGMAGGVASGLGFLLSTLGSAFLPVAADLLAEYGVAIAGGGALAGVVVTVIGHYFGRDLRAGVTREVE